MAIRDKAAALICPGTATATAGTGQKQGFEIAFYSAKIATDTSQCTNPQRMGGGRDERESTVKNNRN